MSSFPLYCGNWGLAILTNHLGHRLSTRRKSQGHSPLCYKITLFCFSTVRWSNIWKIKDTEVKNKLIGSKYIQGGLGAQQGRDELSESSAGPTLLRNGVLEISPVQNPFLCVHRQSWRPVFPVFESETNKVPLWSLKPGVSICPNINGIDQALVSLRVLARSRRCQC